MPAQLAELGSAIEELSARTEAPQRGWARSEALYLLELAQRRLELERDVRTAIVAMEHADARLSTLRDPALGEVRRLIAAELGALRAVPVPDLPAASGAHHGGGAGGGRAPDAGRIARREGAAPERMARRDPRSRGSSSGWARPGAGSSRCVASIPAVRRW